ncbi:putative threonyl-tRNA synthetase [Monocercomonoides exilis]|uniref:putative threonyl-tRNA synthetase n=1 Tax=Monocercomonoides exilis TaxID=2049356 RepID=UPI00355A0D0B|nr:putative threonyl-tRNA synthetase [Monocercomonoides exilis]|eukprot:MONOS_211.1-p1 / transcript=MONOS_211.1 / gene=MONOS_211 / organism=Monocercomonoides_exilis_PA203 / gene_product=threonyl-tRNA synthetase / transcript_product=threonyl-tRNA synthetase / location=Mono_scaffold00003:270493-272833(-) / protein_length=663 / sequence_SO=supercontig / SO=protein_coding / is_pseudo=false
MTEPHESFETDCDGEDSSMRLCHSCAHVLGYAICDLFPNTHLAYGPALKGNQFFYEGEILDKKNRPVTIGNEQLAQLETKMQEIVEKVYPFERKEYSIDKLKDIFKRNPFKQYLLNGIKEKSENGTTYKCGKFEDLCRGPHVENTGKCQFFKLVKVTSATFPTFEKEEEQVQRIYGVCFETNDQFEDWKKLQTAADREHTKIGREQDLYFFHELSPGSGFFLPNGTHIYTTLQELMRRKQREFRYIEVMTPQMFDKAMWETSGHWTKYKENIFVLESEKRTLGIKPMNCPGHCLIYKHASRSYRDLPMRMAEFGCCHRNELSGTLHGLTRVRRFTQDDAHIFCKPEDVGDELKGCLRMMAETYTIFGLKHSLCLSTRPKKYIGDLEQWNQAEAELERILKESGVPFEVDVGGGAFYGPKIDVYLHDSLARKIQCATIQLDFQLPRRFNLLYQKKAAASLSSSSESKEEKKEEDKEAIKAPAESSAPHEEPASSSTTPSASASSATPSGPSEQGDNFVEQPYDENFYGRPVMIHRAILGSFERFIAIITEHFNKKWPFWLSPRQAIVINIGPQQEEYADKVYDTLRHIHGFTVEKDTSTDKLGAKVRNAQMQQFNYILVVGNMEMEDGTVAVRTRDPPEKEKPVVKKLDELIAEWKRMKELYQ